MALKEIKYKGDYKLELIFSNGKKRTHDFKHFLFNSHHPLVNKYRRLALFKKVKIDSIGCLTWGDNEMDLNPYNLPE